MEFEWTMKRVKEINDPKSNFRLMKQFQIHPPPIKIIGVKMKIGNEEKIVRHPETVKQQIRKEYEERSNYSKETGARDPKADKFLGLVRDCINEYTER